MTAACMPPTSSTICGDYTNGNALLVTDVGPAPDVDAQYYRQD
jgi:hypothetical protein